MHDTPWMLPFYYCDILRLHTLYKPTNSRGPEIDWIQRCASQCAPAVRGQDTPSAKEKLSPEPKKSPKKPGKGKGETKDGAAGCIDALTHRDIVT